MAVNSSHSPNVEMNIGATEGKYRRRRPNTRVVPGMGDETVMKNRADLHPYMNYGFINSEEPTPVNPGA